ncbi:MAG: hypothetical protein ABWY02_07750 [Telluria sp.]
MDDRASDDEASGATVAGCIAAFAPGVSTLHRTDVLQSLLLAQLAANAKAERHKSPSPWFNAYRGVMEQTAWVVEGSVAAARYLPGIARFSVGNVVNDIFRNKLAPEELACVMATVNAVKSDVKGLSQLVFECPSHSGGIGNFQIALATQDDDGTLNLAIAQISFNAPQHVTRLMTEEFTSTAQFQTGFLFLTQNESVYATLRDAIARKVESRFAGSVALLQLA